jgi:hypothetical protein
MRRPCDCWMARKSYNRSLMRARNSPRSSASFTDARG